MQRDGGGEVDASRGEGREESARSAPVRSERGSRSYSSVRDAHLAGLTLPRAMRGPSKSMMTPRSMKKAPKDVSPTCGGRS